MKQQFKMATRWGIVSTGKISHDFATALGTLPAEEHQIIAVAAQELSRAQRFAETHKIPNAYGNYEDLAKNPDIDVVYVGNLNTQHYDVSKLSLEHGKNVLCEKPLTMNAKQTTELLDYAKKKNLFLMEGIWSRFFPTYKWLLEEIESGKIGEIKQVIATFGAPVGSVDRVREKSLGGGTILGLGVYTLQFASYIFKGETPTAIKAVGHLNSSGVDESMSAVLTYANGRTATIATSACSTLPNEGIVVGTEGTVKVPTLWCPTQIVLASGEIKTLTLPEPAHPLNHLNGTGMRYEAAEVRRCLQEGLKESPTVTHKDSILIAQLEDEIRKQVGVVFSVD